VIFDLLEWKELPPSRQGFLLNNDQRTQNVQNRMRATKNSHLPTGGAILLFDDYTGSGATLKEATRALRKEAMIKQDIVPVTIASVKWKLGSPGMI
jgi:ATP-dependent DNA helicase RecQ